MSAMKAALLVESLTGNTTRAAERIAGGLSEEGWSITGMSKVRRPDLASVQQADVVLALGTRLNPFSTLPGYGDTFPNADELIRKAMERKQQKGLL